MSARKAADSAHSHRLVIGVGNHNNQRADDEPLDKHQPRLIPPASRHPECRLIRKPESRLSRRKEGDRNSGRGAGSRSGPGKLTPQEYFYYRLWDAAQEEADKRRFVGKIAQHPMHVAAGTREWFAASADKILFQSIMDGAGLRTPELIAATQAGRYLPNAPVITDPATLADKLRDTALYPLFAKQVAGKYSLSVLSADGFDRDTDDVLLLDGTRQKITDVASSLVGGSGFLVQRRLSPAPDLAARFGPRLWSARLLVLVTPSGPVIHRAVGKIATGTNPADNYWRPGNRLGAIDLASGQITRVVHGAGADLVIDAPHPDTGTPIVGTTIPGWQHLTDMVRTASQVFAGIRTQSWDVALTADGPVLLELNFGGDLNLHQLAHGAGSSTRPTANTFSAAATAGSSNPPASAGKHTTQTHRHSHAARGHSPEQTGRRRW